MNWKRAALLWALAIGLMTLAACHHDRTGPCQELVAQQVQCDFSGQAGLKADGRQALVESCQKERKSIRMRTAIDCLKAKECEAFVRCRKEAEELKGLKTEF